MTRSDKCTELAKRLRTKWEKRNTIMASGSEEFLKTDREAALLIALVQETCGREAQSVIDEIWKARV